MRYQLLDRVDAHEPGRFLRGCKFLALGEEYLADHFPRFPVMPGVLMLQSLVESASWLWRVTTGFQHPVIALQEVKNVKYGSFMLPGRRLDLAVDLVQADPTSATFKGKGLDDARQQTIAAQFTLRGYSLSDRSPAGMAAEQRLLDELKIRWAQLLGDLK